MILDEIDKKNYRTYDNLLILRIQLLRNQWEAHRKGWKRAEKDFEKTGAYVRGHINLLNYLSALCEGMEGK